MCTYGLKGTCAYFYHAEHLEAGDAAYNEAECEQVYQEGVNHREQNRRGRT